MGELGTWAKTQVWKSLPEKGIMVFQAGAGTVTMTISLNGLSWVSYTTATLGRSSQEQLVNSKPQASGRKVTDSRPHNWAILGLAFKPRPEAVYTPWLGGWGGMSCEFGGCLAGCWMGEEDRLQTP